MQIFGTLSIHGVHKMFLQNKRVDNTHQKEKFCSGNQSRNSIIQSKVPGVVFHVESVFQLLIWGEAPMLSIEGLSVVNKTRSYIVGT